MSDLRSTPTLRLRGISIAGGVAVAGLLLAACGSSSSAGSSAAASSAAPSTATSTSAAAGAGGSSAAAGAGIATATGSLGTYLANASGQTLYEFAIDKGTTSACYGSCATYWPPVLTTGTPQVSGDAKASLIGTTKRTDGTMQVTYGGHPLYTYAADAAKGDTKGQGVNASGGLWWVVGTDGTPITGGAAATPSTSATKQVKGGY
jgi:predicted lipoprotein with Yx(FWY)xxD motif